MKKYALIFILFLAATLRLWNLGGVPPSTSNDEASIGYNAYSVSKTGVDEYGTFPLISQRAYDDWRRSTYLLLVVPFVSVLGLNSIPIRLPSVMLSILTVLATYNVVRLLFKKQSNSSEITALSAALLLAISPWHVYISRIGHESNAYLSFFVFGVFYFLEGLRTWKKLLFSMIFFSLSMISYYAGQVIVPLIGVGILAIYWKDIRKIWPALVVFFILLIPILWTLFSPDALVRFHGTSTFDPASHGDLFRKRVLRYNAAVLHRDFLGMVVYNRRVFPVQVFIEGYLSHFSPAWLFTNSGKESFKIPNMGVLNMWEMPFILIGIIVFLFSSIVDGKAKILIALWFFLAAVPASIATQAPHAMRAYAFLPVWQIFSAFGLGFIIHTYRKFQIVPIILFLYFVTATVRSISVNYFSIFPTTQSQSFYYAMSKAVPYVLSKSNQYDSIIFSNEGNLYQSYMDFLYYSRYDPALYQRQGGTTSGGFAEAHHIGKYQFRPITRLNEAVGKRILYVGNVSDFPSDINAMAVFASLDGSPTILAVQK